MAFITDVIWAVGWWINGRLANGPRSDNRAISLLIPIIFGVTIIAMWEVRNDAWRPVNHSATAFLNAVRFASKIDPLGGLRTDNLKVR
jgi:hypothetical protein